LKFEKSTTSCKAWNKTRIHNFAVTRPTRI